VSGPGQTLQDDTLPDHAGRAGGEGTGDSTTGGVLQLLVYFKITYDFNFGKPIQKWKKIRFQ
jgi:hypothetical protein